MSRLLKFVLPALLLPLAASAAFGAVIKPYDATTFAALKAANKPVVVHVVADWCPTCKAQDPIVSQLMTQPAFKDYTVLKVNYDTQKDVRRELNVSQQSTFVVFHGAKEVARTTGDTNKASIATTLAKASG